MKPKKIYYEPIVDEYPLGVKLREMYKDIPWIPIESHNNIPELRARPNTDFAVMKQYLIVGTRKTHKYVENQKVSDYLVPYTSSGCSAMCLYCYLVCNYNKCSYLRLYVNTRDMLEKLIRKSHMTEQPCTFEIGSNSDLILENQITDNLPATIETFGERGRGFITFPTKFSMVEPLLNLHHNDKTIFRMSVNPESIIKQVEMGTASLENRVKALNKMCEAGYRTGLLIAPVILLDGWEKLYTGMLDYLYDTLSGSVKKTMFIEVIFMTYSYVHRAINDSAFPDAVKLYNQEKMTGRGRGKYTYCKPFRADAEAFLRREIRKRFPDNEIVYIA